MKSAIAKVEQYPALPLPLSARADHVEGFYLKWLVILLFAWFFFDAFTNIGLLVPQVAILFVVAAGLFSKTSSHFYRTVLALKAKGLDIDSSTINAIMPWEWLSEVELRHRRHSLIPNYVYFKFKNGSDILILWEDVAKDMDTMTLVSCVRTWAPHALIKGDVNVTKSESIATYTELWLKDLSKSERRLKLDQTHSPGTVLSDSYKIERALSGGGQGTAYLASVLGTAEVIDLPSPVVLKEFVLPSNDRGLQKAKESLMKEVAILKRINHPQVIKLYDFFIEDLRAYLVIEFVEGISLRQMVLHNHLQPEETVRQIGASLCEALSYLHRLSPPIIHGDVTPDNVMLQPNGRVKVLDFDAAQELTKSKTNTVIGKHAYMSPEQFKGALLTASDIYALGCTLHFLLTGQDPEPISEAHPRQLNQSVSEDLDEIVATATKFNESQRFADLDQMRRRLERA